jgi:hypothetical protein
MQSRTHHISMLLLSSMAAVQKEKNGAMSVAFDDADRTGQGFQIYMTPYAETQITEATSTPPVSETPRETPQS